MIECRTQEVVQTINTIVTEEKQDERIRVMIGIGLQGSISIGGSSLGLAISNSNSFTLLFALITSSILGMIGNFLYINFGEEK